MALSKGTVLSDSKSSLRTMDIRSELAAGL